MIFSRTAVALFLFSQDFLLFVNCCYFITAATDVTVTVAIDTPLSRSVCLEHSFLLAKLASSRFLICQWIYNYCPFSQSFY